MPENMNKDLDQAYVKFDDLSVGYNGKAIIHDICIDIKKGEIVALIGPIDYPEDPDQAAFYHKGRRGIRRQEHA